ncbi:MAG: hypothetical protein IID48_19050 [Proteobacteria bacterium]|nr:hypothetical protein [Pseudomonadota bacterium]
MEKVPPDHVAVGRIGPAWGVRGAVKVIPLVDKRERLAPGRSVTVDDERRVIESSHWRKGLVYLKLSGIDDREAASSLRDRFLVVPESELEPLPEGGLLTHRQVAHHVLTFVPLAALHGSLVAEDPVHGLTQSLGPVDHPQ